MPDVEAALASERLAHVRLDRFRSRRDVDALLAAARGEYRHPDRRRTGSPMTDRVRSGSPWEPRVGFCRARRVGDRILVAGTAPVPPPGEPVASSPGDQMRRCGAIAIEAIEQLGGTARDVVRTRMFITDPAVEVAVGDAHRELFGEAEPVATMVVVAGLVDPAWVVEIEVEAVVTA